MMDQSNRQVLEVMKSNGNDSCAECSSPEPEWGSYTIGVFLCTQCASYHRGMGSNISQLKHLKMDRWDDEQIAVMKNIGNGKAKEKYEVLVPHCYKKPDPKSPQVLKEQWIRAKYQRQEFLDEEKQTYTKGYLEGYLLKKSKEDSKFFSRKFVLSEADDLLKYYVKENKEPKATLKLSELNVAFVPEKLKTPNGLQISYFKEIATRHIYVKHESGEEIIKWYMAIRSAKLNRLLVAFPGTSVNELVNCLTKNFPKEGWLWKTGPRNGDAYKKRWFVIDGRKLMYHDNPLDAFPRGEIFLGFKADDYAVRLGVPPGSRDQGYSFTLKTAERSYLLSSETEDDRKVWMEVINAVLNRPLTPQDNTSRSMLSTVKSRRGSALF